MPLLDAKNLKKQRPENALSDTRPSLFASPDTALARLHDYSSPDACAGCGGQYGDLLAARSGAASLAASARSGEAGDLERYWQGLAGAQQQSWRRSRKIILLSDVPGSAG